MRLKDYLRYLKAIDHRLQQRHFVRKTMTLEKQLAELQLLFDQRVETLNLKLDKQKADSKIHYAFVTQPALEEFYWMLEEWRVSIFAQQIRTLIPVSAKRLNKFWIEHLQAN